MDYEPDFDDRVPPSFDRMSFPLVEASGYHTRHFLKIQAQKNVAQDIEAKGFNPGLIVLLVIGGLLLTFLIGNYALYAYAQRTLPHKKKKPVSKKKMKRERLKQGVSAPGE